MQCGALTACRTAEQMGNGSGCENTGCHQTADVAAFQRGFDDLVGAAVVAQFQKAVQPNGHQTAQGQQENQPVIVLPQMGDTVEGVVETGTDQTTEHTNERAQKNPLAEGDQISFWDMQFVQ